MAVSFLVIACSKEPPPDFTTRLAAISDAVDAKIAGSPEGILPDLTTELKALDALVISQSAQSPEHAAQALRRKASIQLYYIEDTAAGEQTLKDLAARFPGTQDAVKAVQMLASLQIQAGLVPGAWFPNFNASDLKGASLSINQFKGKVLLVDFWATWCPPCRAELPGVLEAYDMFHDLGFEIVGISLDSKMETLVKYLEKEGMTWAQTCDLQGWESALVMKYGIMSIPATYLLDTEGRIVASNLRGDALKNELAKLLLGQ